MNMREEFEKAWVNTDDSSLGFIRKEIAFEGYQLAMDQMAKQEPAAVVDTRTYFDMSPYDKRTVKTIKFLIPLEIGTKLYASPVQQSPDIAKLIHYPEHWDTAAYPDLNSALHEILSCNFSCQECGQQSQDNQEDKP